MDNGESREKLQLDSYFSSVSNPLEIINLIDGNELESQIIGLASIGGRKLPPVHSKKRYATNRLALSPEDRQATEEFIVPLLEQTGAQVHRHPLAVIGTIEGKEPDSPPIVMMSHIDTVRDGDMFDGTLGSLAAITILQAIQESEFIPRRNVQAVIVTGEESQPFNMALFGSRALWHGLNNRELAQSNRNGDSVADLLREEGVEAVKRPVFGPLGNELPTPAAVIELHVEQGSVLEEKIEDDRRYKADIGIVESIAAPARFQVNIGKDALRPDETEHPHSIYFRLSIDGKAGHSGATPMGLEDRADGLVEIESFLQQALNEHSDMAKLLTIGDIEIAGQSINKIPGLTETVIRLAHGDKEKVGTAVRFLKALTLQRNQILNKRHPKFDKDAVKLKQIERPEDIVFFDREEMLCRQRAAFRLIRSVYNAARIYGDQEVVGTVGTYDTTEDGKIILGLDLRGMTQEGRQQMLDTINLEAKAAGINLGEALPGSGEPTQSDPSLVQKAIDAIKQFETGEPITMNSKAGHDIQNAARAGVPTVLLFCRSEGGIAHNPDAYTKPSDLEKGARSLAALVLKLASE